MLVFIMVITAASVTLYSMRNLIIPHQEKMIEIPIIREELLKYHHLAVIDLTQIENIITELLDWLKRLPNSTMVVQFVFSSPEEVNIILYTPTKWVQNSQYKPSVIEIPDIWEGTSHHHYTATRSSRIDRPVVALQWIMKHSEEDLYHTDFINIHQRTEGELIEPENKIDWENFRNKTLSEFSYLIRKNDILTNLYPRN